MSMDKVDLHVLNWDLLKGFLHRGTVAVWMEGVPEQEHPLMPGWKFVPHAEGNLLLLDMFIEPGMGGDGFTILYVSLTPVWRLRWRGQWSSKDPGVLGCLRGAILDAHSHQMFFGGRGRDGFELNGFKYVNFPIVRPGDSTPANWWEPQAGAEEIVSPSGAAVQRIQYDTSQFPF
jgi:hypothetical protein